MALHLQGMMASLPLGTVFALDLKGLQTPDITAWTSWVEGRVAAIGALKMLSHEVAEVKSTRTYPISLGWVMAV
ncbi:MAG: hypothetical protein OSB00_14130 [Sphingomonas bacterium]|nr:hypothetical protein [Sphingomonas bacterium]